MTRKVDYTGKEPEKMYVVKDEVHFRTFVSEGYALIYLDKLLRLNKNAQIITYVQEGTVANTA